MAPNKIANKILIGAIAVIAVVAIGLGFGIGKLAKENNELKDQNSDLAAVVQSDEQGMLVLQYWYSTDGYDNIESWWTDYSNLRTEINATCSELLENEDSQFLTDEQKETISNIKNNVAEVRSVTQLKSQQEELAKLAEDMQKQKEEAQSVAAAYNVSVETVASYATSSGGSYDPYGFKSAGVIYDGGTRYTWYSQNVLPGGGLNIPGRHVGDDNLIYDGSGNIVVASSDHAKGTVVDTPFGKGVVYDSGCASGTIDVYTNF